MLITKDISILNESIMDSIQSQTQSTKKSESISDSRLKANCGVITRQISGKLIANLFVDQNGEPCNKMYSVKRYKFYLKPIGDRLYSIIKLENTKHNATNIKDLYPYRDIKSKGESFRE